MAVRQAPKSDSFGLVSLLRADSMENPVYPFDKGPRDRRDLWGWIRAPWRALSDRNDSFPVQVRVARRCSRQHTDQGRKARNLATRLVLGESQTRPYRPIGPGGWPGDAEETQATPQMNLFASAKENTRLDPKEDTSSILKPHSP